MKDTRPRQSGMEAQHERWVRDILNWLAGHNVPVDGMEIPARLKRFDEMLALIGNDTRTAWNRVKNLEGYLAVYEAIAKDEPTIDSIESDLIATAEDIGEIDAHAKIWSAIKAAIDAIKVARKQRDEAQLAADCCKDACGPAFDEIAKICGCPTWEYPGQVIRDVQALAKERDALLVKLKDAP